MNKDWTDITILLDRSGSMGDLRNAVIEGINSFIQKQREVAGKCTLSLIQFDDAYEVNYVGFNIQTVPLLNHDTYRPRGSTALLGAMGKTIDELGVRFASIPENERPGKVLFICQTDGLENFTHATSWGRDYNTENVRSRVKHQTEKYNWEFVFMGANQDAILTAQQYGIKTNSAMTYAATTSGVHCMYATLGRAVTSYRTEAVFPGYQFIKQEDRDAQNNLINQAVP